MVGRSAQAGAFALRCCVRVVAIIKWLMFIVILVAFVVVRAGDARD